MKEYRYIGNSPTDLDGGRPVGPGEYTGPIEIGEEFPKNQTLYDEGLLLVVDEEQELAGERLSARAKELDIEGRSQMSADELRTAIADAEAGKSEES